MSSLRFQFSGLCEKDASGSSWAKPASCLDFSLFRRRSWGEQDLFEPSALSTFSIHKVSISLL